jgi:hypothetical protein
MPWPGLFCSFPYARIVGWFWPLRSAVKAERSEFILSLDGSRKTAACAGFRV